MMNTWFYDTFLVSLFERAGVGRGMWLSQKQTAICVENMERHTMRIHDGDEYHRNHDYYTMEWNGRDVNLSYSKKNGCGNIIFGLTKTEQGEAQKQNEEDRCASVKYLAKIRYESRRDRWEQTIEKLRQQIDTYKEEYVDDLEEYGKPLFDLEEKIEPLERELEIYLSVAV